MLTGGELPALVVIDAVIRLLPGAIEAASTVEESFAEGLLEYPQYTRPAVFRGMDVPAILTSGDHGAVARWRREQAIERTRLRRPTWRPATDGSRGRAILRRRRPSASLPNAKPQPRLPRRVRNRPVTVLDEIVQDQLRSDLPVLATGDTVKVSAKVVEGNRERIQVFEGTVMRLRGGGITRSITVRRIASGVGVERTFKINSPRIEKIEVVRHGVARRAQLYFLRDRVGKAATLRERRTNG